jgi:hypothetical protein
VAEYYVAVSDSGIAGLLVHAGCFAAIRSDVTWQASVICVV